MPNNTPPPAKTMAPRRTERKSVSLPRALRDLGPIAEQQIHNWGTRLARSERLAPPRSSMESMLHQFSVSEDQPPPMLRNPSWQPSVSPPASGTAPPRMDDACEPSSNVDTKYDLPMSPTNHADIGPSEWEFAGLDIPVSSSGDSLQHYTMGMGSGSARPDPLLTYPLSPYTTDQTAQFNYTNTLVPQPSIYAPASQPEILDASHDFIFPGGSRMDITDQHAWNTMASPSPTNSPDWHRQGTCQQPYETLPQLSTSTHSISNVYVPYNATLPNPPPLPYDNIHPQTYHEGAAYHTPAFPRQSGPHRHGAAGTTRRIVHSHQPNTVRPSRAPRPSPYHRPALAGPHTTPHSPGDPSDSTGAYTLSPLAQTLGLGMDDDGFTHAHAWPASFGARLEGLCEVPAAHVVQPGSVPAVRWTAPGGGGGDPDGFRVYGERGEDDVRGWAAPDSLGLALGADSALLREDEPMDEGGGGAGYPAPTQACYDTERGASDSRSYAYAHS